MTDLIDEILAYCAARGITAATFGTYAVRDGKFVTRLQGGGQCLPSTASKARAFIAANPVTT